MLDDSHEICFVVRRATPATDFLPRQDLKRLECILIRPKLHDGPGVPPGVGVLPSPSILFFLPFFFFGTTAGLPPYSPS